MDLKNIGALVGGIVIAVMLVTVVLMPITNDSQKTIGEEATLDNPGRTGALDYKIWDGEDITLAWDPTTKAYTIDGESAGVTLVYSPQHIVIASNDFSARTGGSADAIQVQAQYVTLTENSSNAAFSFEVTDGAYSLTLGTSTYTGNVTWLIYAVSGGDANLIEINNPATTFYTSDLDDIVILGSLYYTGENDTFYSYYNGDLTVNSSYKDSASVNIDKDVTDGYTDIYDTAVTVTIGEETFTPFLILAPKTVTGHEASGAMYEMIGIIPLLIIVGILLGIIGMAFSRRE